MICVKKREMDAQNFIRSVLNHEQTWILKQLYHGDLYEYVEAMREWSDTAAEIRAIAKKMIDSGKWKVGESFCAHLYQQNKKLVLVQMGIDEQEYSGQFSLVPYDSDHASMMVLSEGDVVLQPPAYTRSLILRCDQ